MVWEYLNNAQKMPYFYVTFWLYRVGIVLEIPWLLLSFLVVIQQNSHGYDFAVNDYVVIAQNPRGYVVIAQNPSGYVVIAQNPRGYVVIA